MNFINLVVFNSIGEKTDRIIKFEFDSFSKKHYDHSIYLENKRFLLYKRKGTHKSKERSEIKGSTRKLYRQKGTGNARKGSIKNPIFRGGGRIFGPKTKKYHMKVNKNTKKKVKKFILEHKIFHKQLIIIEDFFVKNPKTKFAIKLIQYLKIDNKKSLFITDKINKNLYLSFRNLKKYNVISINELNFFLLINSYIILFESAVSKIKKILLI